MTVQRQVNLTAAEQLSMTKGYGSSPSYLSFIPLGNPFATAVIQVIFNVQVNTLQVSSPSANWLDIKSGYIIHIGTTPGSNDVGVYRVRLDVSNPFLISIQETAQSDPGLFPKALRPVGISPGQYITVYSNPSVLWVRPSRIIYSGGTTAIFEKDYGILYTDQNSVPAPILNLTIFRPNGSDPDIFVGNHCASFYDFGQLYTTLKFKLDTIIWPNGGSIVTYSTIVDPSWTLMSGSYSSDTFIVRVPVGAWQVNSTVTDSNGKTQSALRYVLIHDGPPGSGATYPPISISKITGDTRTLSGRDMQITMLGDDFETIPEGPMCIIWETPVIGGVLFGVPTAVTQYIGWIFHSTLHMEQSLKTYTVQIVGADKLLKNLGMVSQEMGFAASPSNWAEFASGLNTFPFLLWYLLFWHTWGLTQLFSYWPFTTTGYTRNNFAVPAGSVWDQLSKCAFIMVGCNFGFDSYGSMWTQQPLNLISYASRSLNPVRDILVSSKRSASNLSQQLRPKVGFLTADAFYTSGTADIGIRSFAPGDILGQGPGQDQQTIAVTDQAQLNDFAGNWWEQLNTPFDDDTITIHGNRDVYEPTQMLTVTVQYNNGTEVHNGIVTQVTKTYNPDGTRDITLTIKLETTGTIGTTFNIVQPEPGSQITPPPAPTPTNGLQNGGTAWALDFNNHIARTYNFSATSNWESIIGTGITGNIQGIWLDPYSAWWNSPSTVSPMGIWATTTTGLFYTSNGNTASPVWIQMQAASLSSAISNEIRPASWTPGELCWRVQDNTGQVKLTWLGGYGATTIWGPVNVGIATYNAVWGFDIDQYGTNGRVAYTGGWIGSVRNYSRCVNGATPTVIYTTPVGVVNLFLQKPLKTFSGGPNNQVGNGTSECLVISLESVDISYPAIIAYTTNGGNSWTQIQPAISTFVDVPFYSTSMVATDNSNNIIAVSQGSNALYTTSNLGSTWVNPSNAGANLNNLGIIKFPGAFQYSICGCGDHYAFLSNDFGVTQSNFFGDWGTSQGGGNMIIIIPVSNKAIS